jgi:hypothetical protein
MMIRLAQPLVDVNSDFRVALTSGPGNTDITRIPVMIIHLPDSASPLHIPVENIGY